MEITQEEIEMIVWHEREFGKYRPLVNLENSIEEAQADWQAKFEKKKRDDPEHFYHTWSTDDYNQATHSQAWSAEQNHQYGVESGEIECEKRWNAHGPFYVLEIIMRECYGGPEEGGWWYCSQDLVRWCALPSKEKALALIEFMKSRDIDRPEFKPNWETLGGDETVSSTYPEGYIPSGWTVNRNREYYLSHCPALPRQERPYYE